MNRMNEDGIPKEELSGQTGRETSVQTDSYPSKRRPVLPPPSGVILPRRLPNEGLRKDKRST